MYADETMIPVGNKMLDYVYEIICKYTNEPNIRNSAYWYIYNKLQDKPTMDVDEKYIREVVRAKLGYSVDFSAYN